MSVEGKGRRSTKTAIPSPGLITTGAKIRTKIRGNQISDAKHLDLAKRHPTNVVKGTNVINIVQRPILVICRTEHGQQFREHQGNIAIENKDTRSASSKISLAEAL